MNGATFNSEKRGLFDYKWDTTVHFFLHPLFAFASPLITPSCYFVALLSNSSSSCSRVSSSPAPSCWTTVHATDGWPTTTTSWGSERLVLSAALACICVTSLRPGWPSHGSEDARRKKTWHVHTHTNPSTHSFYNTRNKVCYTHTYTKSL